MPHRRFVLTLRWALDRLPAPAAGWLRAQLGPTWRWLRRRYGTPRPPEVPAPEPAPSPPVRIERFPMALADLDAEALRAVVTDLNQRAEHLGCVVFEGRSDLKATAVIFAGNVERFFMLPVARRLACRVVYVQDLQSGWYQGSETLPDIQTLCRTVLRHEIGNRPCLFFGQSSGGYAALAASAAFRDATALACAPQSFADADIKAMVQFVGIRCLQTPAGLLDLRAELARAAADDALRAVVIAASEAENPYTAHYWMDYLHALRLLDLPSVRVSVVKAQSHVIVHGRLNLFAELLKELEDNIAAPRAARGDAITRFLQAHFS